MVSDAVPPAGGLAEVHQVLAEIARRHVAPEPDRFASDSDRIRHAALLRAKADKRDHRMEGTR